MIKTIITLLLMISIVSGCTNTKMKIKDGQDKKINEKIEINPAEMPAEQEQEQPKIPDEQILADYNDGLSDAMAEIDAVG